MKTEQKGHSSTLQPLIVTGMGYRILILILMGIIGWGAFAYVTQLIWGLGMTGMRKPTYWGLYMVNFVFFIGISHAGTLISAILRVSQAEWRRPVTRAAEAITVFALCIGDPQVLFDPGRIDRIMNVVYYGRFQSPILWDVACIGTYLVGSIIYLYLPLIPDLALCRDTLPHKSKIWRIFYSVLSLGWTGTEKQKRRLEKAINIMAVLIIPIAVSVHTVVSWIFGMTVQPMWHTAILGPYFVVGAIFTGIASIIIAMAILRKVFHLEEYLKPIHFNNLGLLLITLTMLWFYFTLAEYLTTFYGDEPAHMSVFYSKFTGEFAPIFWMMVLFCFGIPFPILAIRRLRTIAGTVIASISVNIGMWLERFTIVAPTLDNPRLPYEVALYHPSWVEWSITAASFATLIFLYAVFVKLFPVISVWELEEGEEKERIFGRAVAPAMADQFQEVPAR